MSEQPGTSSIDAEQWQKGNEEFLAAALTWLRLRLQRMAPKPAAPAPSEPEPSPARGWFFGRSEPEKVPLALPSGSSSTTDLESAESAMQAAAAMNPPPALLILAERLGLSRFERDTLLLCAATELDTRIPSLCADAQQDPARPYPTFALALTLFDDPAWDVLSPEGPLRYWRLLEINQPGAQPLTTSALRADERIVNFIKGLNYVDDRLAQLLTPFEPLPDESLPASQEVARAGVERAIRLGSGNGGSPVVQLVGADPASKAVVARRAAAALGLTLYRISEELIPHSPAELENVARLWRRESMLLPIALFVDAHQSDAAPRNQANGAAASWSPLDQFLARSHGVVLVSTPEVRAGTGSTTRAVEVEKPTPAEQRAEWTGALGDAGGGFADVLAGQFDLNTHTIRQIVRNARESNGGGSIQERVWSACLLETGPRMDRLAQRLEPMATWDDIVLGDRETALLHQLAEQIAHRTRVYDDWGFRGRMNRGLGITALFAGESGTGKTMAAEVIANQLRLNLYRIDLSAVVSKYIGETEKNLRQLFDAADDGGAILFFDEADALFGKRSEVRDSHDRYANIEINYLLQRMESYRGLAILATNMRSALDDAFVRRLRFIVTFAFPGRAERAAIWRKVWPAETPVRGLDFDRLARLRLAGGSISNVALNAAFVAASRGVPVTMPIVLEAARAEYDKLERSVNEAEFLWEAAPAAPSRQPVLEPTIAR